MRYVTQVGNVLRRAFRFSELRSTSSQRREEIRMIVREEIERAKSLECAQSFQISKKVFLPFSLD